MVAGPCTRLEGSVCETELQQPMVLHLLLRLGCAGRRRVLQKLSTAQRAKPLQGAAGCQLTLPGPKDCINFHVTWV